LRDQPARTGLLAWEPAYVDLSASGDLGWTTGPWTFRPKPDAEPTAFGHYVTIWQQVRSKPWRGGLGDGISHPKPTGKPAELTFAPVVQSPRVPAREDERSRLDGSDRELGQKGDLAAYRACAVDDIRVYRDGRAPGWGVEATQFPAGARSGRPVAAFV